MKDLNSLPKEIKDTVERLESEKESLNIEKSEHQQEFKNVNIILKIKNSESLSIKDIRIEIEKIFNENQYQLIDVINEIHEILIDEFKNDKINKDKFCKTIINLKNVENNTLISTSEKLLLSVFISSFY